MSPVRRQQVFGPDLEPIEIITFETPMSSERLKEDFVRGNITVEELDQMLPLVLAAEETDSRTIARHIPQEDGMDMDQVIRIGKGAVLVSIATALILVIFTIVLMGVAGLVYEIAHSV